MYEYIKGHKVKMEEHMLSAAELASMYGLYTLNGHPNGLLVSFILSDFISESNLNVSEYYYPYRHGVMRVYPGIVYKEPLDNFVFDLTSNTQYVYNVKTEKKKINFTYREPVGRIIPYEKERRIGSWEKK